MLFTILLLIMFAISIAYATFENITEQTAQALIYQALVWTAAFGLCKSGRKCNQVQVGRPKEMKF